MNKEAEFKSSAAAVLRSVTNRQKLESYYRQISSIENISEEELRFLHQVQSILGQYQNPIKGIDDQLIREKCQNLARQLESELQSEMLSSELELIERVLSQFRRNGFFTWLLSSENSKSQYDKSTLKSLLPKNEYDVQHLLYSLFRVLFSECRTEVSHDDGYKTVRSDIYISDTTIIEVKSTTRPSMTESKLVEEICADMIRFSQKNHYFFIYDDRYLISDRDQFETVYSKNGSNSNKRVKIYVCYPYLTQLD